MLIDSHCHLHDIQFFTPKEAEEAIEKSHQNGIKKIICIGTDIEDSLAAHDFAINHNDVYWTFGIHPEEHAKGLGKKFEKSFSNFPPIAIGEVGLDYHNEGFNRDAQIKLFNQMLQLANDYNLPVSFHVRNAFDDFFAITNNFPKIRGVVHSFTDSKKTLKKILENTDFYVGVNGLATYSTLPLPPLERILLETDAPFLAPAPHRGKKNNPSYIKDIAIWLSQKLSDLDPAHPTTFDQVATITSKNTNDLFHFS